MIDISRINFSAFDRPEILTCLFHPRAEESLSFSVKSSEDMLIPVEDDLLIGARLHHAAKAAPTILFFHGNGEIVSDYDELGSIYSNLGINFLPVDYRGYGRSTGSPTITGMMRDCHLIYAYVKQWLAAESYPGPLIVMGRSLGSASALELAANYRDEIDGLIIESGFAYIIPLLKLIGIDADALGLREEVGFRNIDKIRNFDKPTLIIHAEYDHIIPFKDGQALFDSSPSPEKEFLMIPNADHNTILASGIDNYMQAIKKLTKKL